MEPLKIFNVKWTSKSAGPSLDQNRRTEIFLAGCKKAREGNPCKECFNKELWSKDVYYGLETPQAAFEKIKKFAPNKFITFVGGEPLDQVEPLAALCELLHNDGFHILVISHYAVAAILAITTEDLAMDQLVKNIDVLIDGEYKKEYRIWDESKAGDGLHDVIGSGNQNIVDFKRYRETGELETVPAGKLEGLYMNTQRYMAYVFKNEEVEVA